ncbi:NAD(P)H-binding protein [Dyadobacter pollutisoli]|uniref:NAD(P)H-binding protein n=1 Tax=Dyadobacter pollutisoli TaxID=2910158 RepID=A0A9E8NG59_9BACT|nr:NAD(P)H-binding protein [Dyadobacter pollutisoli]WAC15323.1 NAD(P)H-binding protein [Dyadobacter pollutisoli]
MKTLVLGGNGKTGRRVVQRLTDLGLPVRIGSRSNKPAFDWDNKGNWKEVLHEISQVYITFQPDLSIPGSVEAIQAFVNAAAKSGVKKLVLLSGRGEPEAQLCEQIVIASGMEWTVVRASWFNQNFSEGYLLDSVQAGYVALPAGDIGEPFIDTDDIADVVVAALTDDIHNGKIYEVTGPRLLTFKQAIAEIAAASGREIVFQEVSIEEYTSMLTTYEIPQDIIDFLSYLFTEVMDGRNESISHGVEEALGRKPTDFSEFAQRAAVAGIWEALEA